MAVGEGQVVVVLVVVAGWGLGVGGWGLGVGGGWVGGGGPEGARSCGADKSPRQLPRNLPRP